MPEWNEETRKRMVEAQQEWQERADGIKADASATYAACEGNPADVRGVELMDAEAARYAQHAADIAAALDEIDSLQGKVAEYHARSKT